jgi:hypothetical protein
MRSLAAAAWICAVDGATNTTLALGAAACTNRASCSDHGNCLNTVCVCGGGWSGDTCADATPTPPLTPPLCHNRTDCAGHGNCLNDEACLCDADWSGDTCAVPVPTPPPTPPSDGPVAARESMRYLLLVLLPFLGRAFESKITGKLQEWLCTVAFGGNALKEALIGSAKGGDADALNAAAIAGQDNSTCKMNWDEALVALGWSRRMGLAVGVLRLVFWHWMQPAMYAASLYAYWNQIDAVQQKLALVVGAREALYPLFTLKALWHKPIFLLANLSSPEKRLHSFLYYVATPEKYATSCALQGSSLEWLEIPLTSTLLPACDICGTAALIVGGMKGTLPAALAVGYSITTLGLVAGIALWGMAPGGCKIDPCPLCCPRE